VQAKCVRRPHAHPCCQSGMTSKRHSYCVAIDGSDLGYKAMRLAMMCMHDKDTLLVIHAVDNNDGTAGKGAKAIDGETLEKNAQVEALKLRLRPECVHAEVAPLKPEGSVAQLIVGIANMRSRTLVVGASGRGAEARRSGSTARPLGSVAEQCLMHTKVPVILVRATNGKFDFKNSDEVNQLQPRPQLTLAVAVDGSNIAKRAFDKAVAMAHAQDRIVAVNVYDGTVHHDPSHQHKNVKPLYEAECSKALALHRVKEARFEGIYRRGGESTEKHISALVDREEADLLCLGSIELANPTKGMYLGSVALGCAKFANTNVCIVKNYV